MALRELLAQWDVKVNDAALQQFNAKLDANIAKVKASQAAWGNLQKEFAARATAGQIKNVTGEIANLGGQAQQASGGLGQAAGALLAAFGGARLLGGIRAATAETLEFGSKVQDTVDRLGVGAEDLQRLAYAAEQTGGSFDGAANALKFFSKSLDAAKTGGDAAKTFASLGVKATDATGAVRPTLEVLSELGDSFAKLSDTERVAKAMDLFGRAGVDMVPILSRGSEGVRQLTGELDELGGVLDGRAVAALDDVGDEGVRVASVFRGLRSRLVVDLAPGLLAAMERVRSLGLGLSTLLRNTNAAKIGLVGVAGAVGVLGVKSAQAFGIIGRFSPGILGFFRGLIGAAAPALLVGAAMAGIALAAEDIYTWLTGGKSAIGAFLEESVGIEGAKNLSEGLRDAWRQLSEAITVSLPDAKEFLNTFVSVLPTIVEWLKITINLITGMVRALQDVFAIQAAGQKLLFGGKESDVAGAKQDIRGRLAHLGNLFTTGEDPNRLKAFGAPNVAALEARNQGNATMAMGANMAATGGLVAGPVVPRNPVDFARGPVDASQTINNNITIAGGTKETGREIAKFVRDGAEQADRRAAQAAIAAGY